jgi:ribosomal protein L37AE/L43A
LSIISDLATTKKGEKIMPEYKCPKCGRNHSWHEAKRIDANSGLHICRKCGTPLDSEKIGNQTQLPEPDQPLVCAFQRRFNSPYRVQCAVTAIGDGGLLSRVFANYEPCNIDICPMYQNWQLLEKAK